MSTAMTIDIYKTDTLDSGPPGVGKTMTAEGLSEHLERPLYTVSVGNFSKDAKLLEAQLCEMFEVAEKWKALCNADF
ncbi:hypothetical protein VC83_04918 [Pseudogymnoascus destructans]|uniref:ATPase AAA-type core domain-containing protein n=1 Tax=Pseudogymnoascus destructans TaxID=655981 RepID=A0A177ABN4_9PEZI|nr:uncharacterized protein VC83_04918 [Pseudogymnoascus destructans]OAF58681.1 hypothetical protein VC83_04918 [Pseudogymnoascus destructans]